MRHVCKEIFCQVLILTKNIILLKKIPFSSGRQEHECWCLICPYNGHVSRLKNSVLRYDSTFKNGCKYFTFICFFCHLNWLFGWLTKQVCGVFFNSQQPWHSWGGGSCIPVSLAVSAKLSAKSQFLNLCQWRIVIEHEVEKTQINFLGARQK